METNTELLLALGRLEGKVDSLIASDSHHVESFTKHDERLRILENQRSALLGAVSVVSAAVSAGVAWVTS